MTCKNCLICVEFENNYKSSVDIGFIGCEKCGDLICEDCRINCEICDESIDVCQECIKDHSRECVKKYPASVFLSSSE